ncbi:hypothetical protein ACFC3O_20030 [Streptomyces sp. NPDC056007]|uniref:hypothetical protein n=1 Tax=Streptomyces sp. NPDC056007 TaxID=3345678 RepID=UPI0035D6203A
MRDVFLISNVAGSVLLLPTGANVPRAGLPEGMRLAGDVLPLTHAMEAAGRGLRAAVSMGDRSGRSRWSEPLVGAGYALLALVLLAVFERGSRRRAPLDVM